MYKITSDNPYLFGGVTGNTAPAPTRPMQVAAERAGITERRPQTPEESALMRAVAIYLNCPAVPDKPCPDDCKLLRRYSGEWAICAHLAEAGKAMLERGL